MMAALAFLRLTVLGGEINATRDSSDNKDRKDRPQ
jgi:hypothetical protein